MGLDSYVTTA